MEKEERNPDLAGPDYNDLEEKVKQMLDPQIDATPKSNGSSSKKVIQPLTPDLAAPAQDIVELPGPPDLPMDKPPLRIKILHDDNDDETPAVIPKKDTKKAKTVPKKKTTPSKKIAIAHFDTDEDTEENPVEEIIPTEEAPAEAEAKIDKSEIIDEEPSLDDTKEPNEIIDISGESEDDLLEGQQDDTSEEDYIETIDVLDEEPSEEEVEPNNDEVEEASDESEEKPAKPAKIDDPITDKAVDDIVAKESDDLLAIEDEKIAKAFEKPDKPSGSKLKRFLRAWWHNKILRNATILLVLIGIAAAAAVPTSRYILLNTFGVRASSSVLVLDESTRQPLKNVEVQLAGKTVLTDNTGTAQFSQIKLGRTELKITRRAFAETSKQLTIGWGSNPLGDFQLTPTGTQYTFVVNDFLSGKPLEKAEATSKEASAFSDDKGIIKLTIAKEDADKEIEVALALDEYRKEVIKLDASTKDEQKLQLVPARKHVFISKRSGKFDVYKIDADGKNEEVVLSGTGTERDDLFLLPHPSEEIVALVSTRDNARNKDGFLLSTLTIIDLSSNSAAKVTQSEKIQIVDWIGDRLTYVQITAGASGSSPKRHRLMSYNYKEDANKEIATSNYFNDVVVANGQVYFAPSSAYQTGTTNFYRINPDGSNQQTIMNKEVWSIFRIEYDKFALAGNNEWNEYKVSENKISKLPGEPPSLRGRNYMNSPNSKRSLWVDQRDGKGVLILYDIEANNEKTLHDQSGLNNPIRWLSNNSVVFRIRTDQETADYVQSLEGGEPKKIRDVTNTSGIESWYYY